MYSELWLYARACLVLKNKCGYIYFDFSTFLGYSRPENYYFSTDILAADGRAIRGMPGEIFNIFGANAIHSFILYTKTICGRGIWRKVFGGKQIASGMISQLINMMCARIFRLFNIKHSAKTIPPSSSQTIFARKKPFF